MYRRVRFNMPDSDIHAAAHCERVLLYALILGADIFGADGDVLDILVHASIFHDTRRQDEYLDTGHGARAAVYYEQFCQDNNDIEFHPESVFLMRYHDLDDAMGKEAIQKYFGTETDRVLNLYAIFKNGVETDRNLRVLETENIGQIDICGLAGDVCVADTIRDGIALKLPQKINVLMDYTSSIDGGKTLNSIISKNKLSCIR